MEKIKLSYKLIIPSVLIFIIGFLIWKFSFLREILNVIILSFIISYFLKPLQKRMVERGTNRSLSAFLLLFILIIFVILWIIVLVPIIIKESVNIKDTLLDIWSYILSFFDKMKFMKDNRLFNKSINKIYEQSNLFVGNLVSFLMSFGGNLLTYLIIPVLIFYFLAQGELIKNKVLFFLPYHKRKAVKEIIGHMDKILSRYIISQLLLCIFIGVFTYITLLALKVPYPLMLALFNCILNIIPYFGAIFGCIPAILVALLSSPNKAIWVTFWLVVIQQLEGNIISPKVIGDTVNIHPLVVIILLIVGEKLGGFIGMVIAIPLGVVIKVILEDMDYYLF